MEQSLCFKFSTFFNKMEYPDQIKVTIATVLASLLAAGCTGYASFQW